MTQQASGRRPAQRPPTGHSLVVVESDEDRCASVTAWLTARGYDVITQRDVAAAVTVVGAREPRVAILGQRPNSEAMAACAQLQAAAGRPLPIIVLAAPGAAAPDSGWPHEVSVLATPVDPADLMARVDSGVKAGAPPSDWVQDALARLHEGAVPEDAQAVGLSGPAADRRRDADHVPSAGLLDAIDDGLAVVDPDGRILWGNAALAGLLGVAAPELAGQRLGTLLPTPGRMLSTAVADADTRMTTTAARGDGTTASLDLDFRPVDRGPDARVLVTVRDASPRLLVEQTLHNNRELSEQLRRSQKIGALGRLAGGVAHDFNNLLQVIGGYAEALDVDRLDRDARRRLLGSIQRATDRASSLTRQLLAFGRRQVLVPQVLDLNATVQSLQHLLRRVIGEDIHLVSALAPDLLPVKVDPGQIEQVMLNLALNARDAMLDGGTLEISTRNLHVSDTWSHPNLPVTVGAGDWVRVSVRDTGCGMDADTAAQAFEPFFTTKDASSGSGLGLSMVYGIVKQSDGYTWIETAPAEGTSVHVLLPASTGAVVQTVRDDRRQTAAPAAIGGTVLLVEDDAEVRSLFAAFLRHAGYDVLEAADGRDALATFETRASGVDVVVTDVVMPNLGGPALAAALRARRPEVKLLFVSGYNDQLDPVVGASEAGTAHLAKPVTRGDLLARVAALIAQAPAPPARRGDPASAGRPGPSSH